MRVFCLVLKERDMMSPFTQGERSVNGSGDLFLL